jgi:hypothetical protein
MYAKLSVWRLGAEYRDGPGYERFLRNFAPASLQKLRQYGMLDGFIVRLTHNTVLTVNLYETADGAYSAWHNVVSREDYAAAGDLEMLFHLISRGDDLPMVGEMVAGADDQHKDDANNIGE